MSVGVAVNKILSTLPQASKVSKRIVLWELHDKGGRGVEGKAQPQLEASEVCHCGILEWWIMLHYVAAWWMNLGLVNSRRMLPVWMHNSNCKVWWRRNNSLWLFFMAYFQLINLDNMTMKWFSLCGMIVLGWPAPKTPFKHLWDDLLHQLWARPYCVMSVPNIIYAHVGEWEQISANRIKHHVDSLPRSVGPFIAADQCLSFWMGTEYHILSAYICRLQRWFIFFKIMPLIE